MIRLPCSGKWTTNYVRHFTVDATQCQCILFSFNTVPNTTVQCWFMYTLNLVLSWCPPYLLLLHAVSPQWVRNHPDQCHCPPSPTDKYTWLAALHRLILYIGDQDRTQLANLVARWLKSWPDRLTFDFGVFLLAHEASGRSVSTHSRPSTKDRWTDAMCLLHGDFPFNLLLGVGLHAWLWTLQFGGKMAGIKYDHTLYSLWLGAVMWYISWQYVLSYKQNGSMKN